MRIQSLASPLGSSVKWRMSKPGPLFLSQRSSYLRFYILDPPPGKLQTIGVFDGVNFALGRIVFVFSRCHRSSGQPKAQSKAIQALRLALTPWLLERSCSVEITVRLLNPQRMHLKFLCTGLLPTIRQFPQSHQPRKFSTSASSWVPGD
jgi:hypothetical protein